MNNNLPRFYQYILTKDGGSLQLASFLSAFLCFLIAGTVFESNLWGARLFMGIGFLLGGTSGLWIVLRKESPGFPKLTGIPAIIVGIIYMSIFGFCALLFLISLFL